MKKITYATLNGKKESNIINCLSATVDEKKKRKKYALPRSRWLKRNPLVLEFRIANKNFHSEGTAYVCTKPAPVILDDHYKCISHGLSALEIIRSDDRRLCYVYF